MKAGVKHIVFCSTSLAPYDRRIQRITKTLSSQYKIAWISRDEVNLPWLEHKSLNPLINKGFLFYALFNIRLFFKLLVIKCDIICSIDLDTVLACYLVSRLRGKTLVFDAHEYFTEVPELAGRKFVKSFWLWIEKLCLRKIEYNYTVGPELSKIFAERHGKKYEVIRNVPLKKLGSKKRIHDNETIVYLGMVNEGRGVELAIESLIELKDKKLKIIGSGDIESEMKALVEKLKLESRVHFLGYIHPDQIVEEMDSCWIAINMLDPISKSYYYSLANKFFDYLQVGIPTINMSFPEYVSINENYNTGYLAKEYSVAEFIKGVKLLESKEYYESCVADLNSAQSTFCWEEEANTLLDFYSLLA